MSSVEALPLLERAIIEGKNFDPVDIFSRDDLAIWVDQVILVIQDTDSINPVFLSTFQTSMNGIWKGGFDDSTKRRALRRTIALLEGQAEILKAKIPATSSIASRPVGSKIFIGHGGAPAWMELARYLERQLHLVTDDFDGVFPAGNTVIGRLTEMLDQAAFAFIVMTAEDALTEDEIRARQNVVHEAGLFQGRLGFNRTIVLLEKGCTSFSNIDGLIYIGFPKGGISSVFHRVHGTLETHGLLKPLKP